MLALGVLILPLQWLFAWMLSVAIHELGHLLCLKFCGVSIDLVEISGFGAKIRTAPIGKREWICALAGPCAGMSLVLFSKWIPTVAVCAVIHSMFNLLPVYPLDGGRALRSVLSYVIPQKYALIISNWIGYVTVGSIILLLLRMPSSAFQHLLLSVAFAVILVKLSIKTPCKRSNKRVQ